MHMMYTALTFYYVLRLSRTMFTFILKGLLAPAVHTSLPHRFLPVLQYNVTNPAEIAEEFVRKVNQAANGFKAPRSRNSTHGKSLDLGSNSSLSNGQLSDALIPHKSSSRSRPQSGNGASRTAELPSLPSPVVHQIYPCLGAGTGFSDAHSSSCGIDKK